MDDSRGQETHSAMANPRAQRSITDFLINPTTVKMENHCSYEQVEKPMPATPPYHALTLDSTKQTTDTGFSVQQQRGLSHGYASEEELASPVDNDDFSFGSLDSDAESIWTGGNPSLESLIYIQPQCSRAQAVQVMSVGKAKVVSMPRIGDELPPLSHSRPQTSSDSVASKSSLEIMSSGRDLPMVVADVPWHSGTHDDVWSDSLVPIVGTDHISQSSPVRRRPVPMHVPQCESAREMALMPRATKSLRTVNFLDYHPATSSSASPKPSSTRSKRRAYKLPSAFHIKNLSWNMKQNYCATTTVTSSTRSPDHVEMKPRSSSLANINANPATSRKPLPKMVPRGANEREPPIVLPPCPYDDEDDEDDDYSRDDSHTAWMRRKGSTTRAPATCSYQSLGTYGTDDRRKSLPAFVSADV